MAVNQGIAFVVSVRVFVSLHGCSKTEKTTDEKSM